MMKNAFQHTIGIYRHLITDIVIAVFALLGGFVAKYYDPLGLIPRFDPSLAYGVYALALILLSFPSMLFLVIVRKVIRQVAQRPRAKFDIQKLRLADGVFRDGTWQESQEHSLTLINETGHDLSSCYVMLDEVAWKNFDGEWEIVAGNVFSEPFKWNNEVTEDGKVNIENGDRASFAVISHDEYQIYNSSTKQNEASTDFHFVFHGRNYARIGYGSDIRLLISVRGKNEGGNNIHPGQYLLYVHLLQQHGIPKVDFVRTERLST